MIFDYFFVNFDFFTFSDAWLPHSQISHSVQISRQIKTEKPRRQKNSADLHLHRLHLRNVELRNSVSARPTKAPETGSRFSGLGAAKVRRFGP